MKFKVDYSGSVTINTDEHKEALIDHFELEDDDEGEDGGKTAEEKVDDLTEAQLQEWVNDEAIEGNFDDEMTIDNIDAVTKV